jgi:pilus assembly protein CpaB
MSFRSLMMVVMSLVFGASAAVGVNSFVRNPPTTQGEVVPVVVASTDLPRGGNISADVVKVKEFPKDLAPAGALSKMEDAVDRGIYIPMTKDEPILENKLAPKGAGRGMAALIPNGMRAYTIQTPNVAQGVAGFILPGNKVDVLLAVSESAGAGAIQLGGGSSGPIEGGTTTMLLQNIEILAVDQKVDAPAENKMNDKELRSVTLLVSPQQANLLTLAQKKGDLYLALRNLKDNAAASTKPATLSELRFHQEKPWDERAKGVLEALGKALAQRAAAPPLPAPPLPKAPGPPMIPIRTIRGVHEGAVLIQGTPGSSTNRRSAEALGAGN